MSNTNKVHIDLVASEIQAADRFLVVNTEYRVELINDPELRKRIAAVRKALADTREYIISRTKAG